MFAHVYLFVVGSQAPATFTKHKVSSVLLSAGHGPLLVPLPLAQQEGWRDVVSWSVQYSHHVRGNSWSSQLVAWSGDQAKPSQTFSRFLLFCGCVRCKMSSTLGMIHGAASTRTEPVNCKDWPTLGPERHRPRIERWTMDRGYSRNYRGWGGVGGFNGRLLCPPEWSLVEESEGEFPGRALKLMGQTISM
ncbi:hypothetical protein RRG08_034785 [Elysia crispata]|uniref:Uncharacterized protein n=1 Tax=Elysia crispata TaxID=231223 RepID=A0AAE0YBU8_9GAST|nr:hypothetical protein RRG08_034785 [Elysia crispata]